MNDLEKLKNIVCAVEAVEALRNAEPNSPEGIVFEKLEMVLFKLQAKLYDDLDPLMALI